MGKIYLIRHGQTDSNLNKSFQGRINTPLNAVGMAQAEKLAAYLKDVKLDAVYCSSLQRAVMTAEALAKAHNLNVNATDLLQEVSFGAWEGLNYENIEAGWPGQIDLFFTNPEKCRVPDGESFADVQKRTDLVWQQILTEHGNDKNIAVVSHGGVIRVQICSLLGIPLNNLWKLNVHNASVSIFSNWEGSFFADVINDYHYL